MKIKKGDKVKVFEGKDAGRDGVVERVYSKSNTVLIQKINLYKRHIKKNEKLPQGGVVEIPRPIDVSKLMIICPKCTKAVRLGYVIEKNKKFRICKKCKSKI
ncbi:MAG: 50S ribosomal protein L24 [bacterium]|nr:50S ribosomal protein L24 [bacterium]